MFLHMLFNRNKGTPSMLLPVLFIIERVLLRVEIVNMHKVSWDRQVLTRMSGMPGPIIRLPRSIVTH